MPCKNLSLKAPYESLLAHIPLLDNLKVFSCAYFPLFELIKPTSYNKKKKPEHEFFLDMLLSLKAIFVLSLLVRLF